MIKNLHKYRKKIKIRKINKYKKNKNKNLHNLQKKIKILKINKYKKNKN